MTVKVLFFGGAADLVGSRVLEVTTDEKTTSQSFLDVLLGRFPSLEPRKLLIAVNEEYSGPETVLNDGDEVAIFTAVSGG